jgi:hypothetical protein
MMIVKAGPEAKKVYSINVTLPKSYVELKAFPNGLVLTDEELHFAGEHGLRALAEKGIVTVEHYEKPVVVVKAPEPVKVVELPPMMEDQKVEPPKVEPVAPIVPEAVPEPIKAEPVKPSRKVRAEQPKVEEPKEESK